MARPSGKAGVKLFGKKTIQRFAEACKNRERIKILGGYFMVSSITIDYHQYSISVYSRQKQSATAELIELAAPANQETPAQHDTDTAPHAPDAPQ
jgi:hypothetical protein